MQIKGIEGVTPDQIQSELSRGAKFLVFTYTVSGFIWTPMALATNLGGGKDVTAEVTSRLLSR